MMGEQDKLVTLFPSQFTVYYFNNGKIYYEKVTHALLYDNSISRFYS